MLIISTHATGKTHGAASPDKYVGGAPATSGLEEQQFGWPSTYNTGAGPDAITSGIEVVWSKTPTKWSNDFLHSLFGNEWTLQTGPGGAYQWIALNGTKDYPSAFSNTTFNLPRMMTSDLALREDPTYANISMAFRDDFTTFTNEFAHAWYVFFFFFFSSFFGSSCHAYPKPFISPEHPVSGLQLKESYTLADIGNSKNSRFKLTHRDMGPRSRYLGPEVPAEKLIWQDPLPDSNATSALSDADIASLKSQILASGLSRSALISTAWSAASTYRHTDKRGGANGARIRLEPQVGWAINSAAGTNLSSVLSTLEGIQTSSGTGVSLADLIVLGGSAAVEAAAQDAGFANVTVPFLAGRVDATQDQTDVATFGYLEPRVDGFRNYGSGTARAKTESYLVDRANLMGLTAPEMTVLVGGLRVLNTNYDGSAHGVFTSNPGQLTNDFFVNLLDMKTKWTAVDSGAEVFEGTDRSTGAAKWTATRNDLVFGSHSELRAIAEVYAMADAGEKFATDFVAAWNKVMNADRFDVQGYGVL